MKKIELRNLIITLFLFALFVIFTILVKLVDVQEIGPNGSSVGFATMNGAFHNLIDSNLVLYNVTDWGGLIPLSICAAFFILGLIQWISRRSILKVDSEIIALGLFYILVFVVYIFFELVVINRRPVLIGGSLEASYPSSTTMLSFCFMFTAGDLSIKYIKNNALRFITLAFCVAIGGFLVVGRIISGVHWLSDVMGAMIVSSALIAAYYYFKKLFARLLNKQESIEKAE